MKNQQFQYTDKDGDTIVAISTPPGIGGIGIVRLSGPRSIEIASKIFRYKGNKRKNLEEFHSHRIYYGTIVAPGKDTMADEVLLTVMRKPESYTREDVVEINCHGGYLAINKVLEIVQNMGARIAEPGEFTKLAFLNGRIDLSQAEAVIDIIKASNEKSWHSSLRHLSGDLRTEINNLKNRIIDINARIEAVLDFPDQGLPEIDHKEITSTLKKALSEISELLNTVKYGQLIKEGINAIILGKTNVGKSSLFNILLKQNKSIVTPLPGTTRDLIEGFINIKGLTFNLIDTAGMKSPENIIEKISLERVDQQMEYARLFLVMFDISEPLDANDIKLIEKVRSFHNRNNFKIIILNKTDLPARLDEVELQQRIGEKEFIKISIKKKTGIDTLTEKMSSKVLSDLYIPEEGLVISNKRHQESLLNIKNCLVNLITGLEKSVPIDLVSLDLKYIINQLGKITGESYDEEMLNHIFSQFCIGK
ncbi:MAG TPA: tRNA uridine-5-carboxymethylaminomethyl(34) synthesis GTPase MnmE [Atribacterota bacterium]|nr:tRNA uridine-5-carboxymethylaminomethyl(34) synthesis GTPase MnmE [Atribacterota bacterium]